MNRTYGIILAAVVVVLALWLIMSSGGEQTTEAESDAPAATEDAGATAEGDQPAN